MDTDFFTRPRKISSVDIAMNTRLSDVILKNEPGRIGDAMIPGALAQPLFFPIQAKPRQSGFPIQ